MPASPPSAEDAVPARKTPPQFAQYKKIRPGTPKEAELIEQYLPFVKNVVGRLALSLPSHVDLDDLYSAGLVGLLNAVRNYDPTAGSSFESYARVRIRGSIFDELRRLDWVPRSVHDKARKVQAVIQQIEQSKGQPPLRSRPPSVCR
jgi:RNA polymerase sigma factor for flagellar operon FliA